MLLGSTSKPPQKEMTRRGGTKLLNVWEPTKEWLAKYDNLETRDQAIAEQRDGLIRQADTIMRYRMNEMQQAMEQTVWTGYASICSSRRRGQGSSGLRRRFPS